jgi:hypothetical protein
MKKITYLAISFVLLICVNGCTGYEPIFSSTKSQIEIVEHSIKGNKKLGNKIYSQLRKAFGSNKNNPNAKTVHATIEVLKNKNATVKNSAGKILEYKIIINTNILLKDSLTEDVILNYSESASSSYKIQDQYSETKKMENKTTENLINKIYQDILIKISVIK